MILDILTADLSDYPDFADWMLRGGLFSIHRFYKTEAILRAKNALEIQIETIAVFGNLGEMSGFSLTKMLAPGAALNPTYERFLGL